jgi:glucokinase
MTVVGIDLGGTKVAAASLHDGELGSTAIEPTDRCGREGLLDQIAGLVDRVKRGKLEAVGIGVPSVVEFKTGRVISSVNVPLVDVPIRQVLGERLGVPVFVDNDATVAALAEAHDEQLRMVAENLVMITVGTGIGGGLVLGGRIYRGGTGGAGELGHTLVAADPSRRLPAPERFPQPGSLERVAAGSALDRVAAQVAANQPSSALGLRRANGRPVLGADIVQAARGGDPAAIDAVETWAEHVGIGVANAINTFDPDEVVLGGGAARAGELLLEPARRVARAYVVPGLGRSTKIRLARHGARAGVLGAGLLALHELQPSLADLRAGRAALASPASPTGGGR